MPIIQQETADMMDKEWKSLLSGGEVGDSFSLDVFHTMSELTIRTASACLMGKEIRDELHSNGKKSDL